MPYLARILIGLTFVTASAACAGNPSAPQGVSEPQEASSTHVPVEPIYVDNTNGTCPPRTTDVPGVGADADANGDGIVCRLVFRERVTG